MAVSRALCLGILLVAGRFQALAQTPDFDAARDETVRTLRDLIRLDTSNPPGKETLVAEYLRDALAADGISSEIYALEPERGNLVARLKGDGSKQPILLMAHSDVVGVELDKWTVDPFGGDIRDGYLYGRGAIDDKDDLALYLQLFRMLHRAKLPLARDIVFLAEAGEEGTTHVGIDFMVEEHWDVIACEFAINEGGVIRMRDGEIRTVGVATTEKVPWRGVRLVARGTSGHGSVPRVDNPVVRLAAAVAKLGTIQSPMRLNETTRAYFSRMADISPAEEAFLYRNLENPALTDMLQEQLRHTDILANSLLRTSISPNIIEGGFRRNVIPATAEATLDIRALPDEDLDDYLEWMSQIIDDPLVEITRPTSSRPKAPPSSLDSEMFQALTSAQERVFPDAVTLPTMLTGATDSAQIRAKGAEAYGIGTVLAEDDSRAHGNDERVWIEGLGLFLEYLYTAVVDVAARP